MVRSVRKSITASGATSTRQVRSNDRRAIELTPRWARISFRSLTPQASPAGPWRIATMRMPLAAQVRSGRLSGEQPGSSRLRWKRAPAPPHPAVPSPGLRHRARCSGPPPPTRCPVATPTLNGHFRTPVVGRSSELVSARVTVSDSPGNGHEIWTGGFGTAATARAGAAVKCVAREHAPTAHCDAGRLSGCVGSQGGSPYRASPSVRSDQVGRSVLGGVRGWGVLQICSTT